MYTMIACANLVWLLHPESEPYVFYRILITWSNYFYLHYGLALLRSVITIICLAPLFAFAFNRPAKHLVFWQWMLVIRVIFECMGNYYEFVFVKSAYHMLLGYGLSVTGAFLLPLLPSYCAHYFYAFPLANDPQRNGPKE